MRAVKDFAAVAAGFKFYVLGKIKISKEDCRGACAPRNDGTPLSGWESGKWLGYF